MFGDQGSRKLTKLYGQPYYFMNWKVSLHWVSVQGVQPWSWGWAGAKPLGPLTPGASPCQPPAQARVCCACAWSSPEPRLGQSHVAGPPCSPSLPGHLSADPRHDVGSGRVSLLGPLEILLSPFWCSFLFWFHYGHRYAIRFQFFNCILICISTCIF